KWRQTSLGGACLGEMGSCLLGALPSFMTSPRISIVISSFNQGNYLETAIQSVLRQGYPDTEMIIVDGASADSSLDVIRRYSGKLAWWVSEPDRGQSEAINKGFTHCTGDIVTFLSSDDYYLPGAFVDVVEMLQRHPETGVIVGAFSFLEEGQARPNEPLKPFLGVPSPVDLSLGPPGVYRLHQVATFYTRRALDVVGHYVREDMKYVMDRELLYRVCRAFPIALSEQTYGVFRRHSESKSTASILPFAREFAALYLSLQNGNASEDALRKKMARYRLSRGYVKFARAVHRFPVASIALLRAGFVYPENFLQRRYWKNYLMWNSSGNNR
ncbi:MAG: glycosyltransferase family 2 protein, partial [Chloroflexota bacterium]